MNKKSSHREVAIEKDIEDSAKKSSTKRNSQRRGSDKEVNAKNSDKKKKEKRESTKFVPTVAPGPPIQPRSRTKYKTFILSESAVFEVEQRYQIKEIIGHGAYGTVCCGFDLKTKKSVAIKKVQKIFNHRSLAKRTLRELIFLRYFNHENIMNLLRVMRPNKHDITSIYMVCEYMETDLAMVIRSPQSLTEEHCQFFLYQVLRGLKYIHSASVIHRDLKPRNLLVNSNCDLKICDFGLARTNVKEFSANMSNYIATRWYRSPEVILSQARYNASVDMWAVGCILAELLHRRPIFPGRDSFHQISLIISILGTPKVMDPGLGGIGKKNDGLRSTKKANGFLGALPKKTAIPFNQVIPNASSRACDLLSKLLVFDPDKRLTVGQALAHPFFEDLHYEDDEPICDTLNMEEFHFETMKVSTKDLQVLIRREVLSNYPEDTFCGTEPIFQFNKRKSISKRTRRKSYP